MSRNFRGGSQFPRVSRRTSLWCRLNFEHVQKISVTNFLSKYSQSRRGCLEPVSDPSQFNFRESEGATNVRQLCEGLATDETKL